MCELQLLAQGVACRHQEHAAVGQCLAVDAEFGAIGVGLVEHRELEPHVLTRLAVVLHEQGKVGGTA